MMKTAASTNKPRAKKLNAVPVLFSTLVREVDRTDRVMLGMDDSMLATTTSPTIIVTAAKAPTQPFLNCCWYDHGENEGDHIDSSVLFLKHNSHTPPLII